MTQQVYGTQEVAGRVELNTLIINNDSSEFCCVWIADHADINTKKMAVTGTKQTVDIESKMSGYSVGFGNVFNPFVTGAVASALPTYSNFDSDGKQHLERRTASVLNFNSANIKTVDLELHHGIINADNLNLEVERNFVIEHLKEANTSWNNLHSFGMNFGAMVNFGMNPGLINGMMSTPVVRKVSSSFVRENYSCGAPGAGGAFARQAFASQSGIYAKENHISIGKTIEMTPTLRNEEKTSVFDMSMASSIGSMMSGVQEVQCCLTEMEEHAYHDIIIDAEPVENEVITEASKEEKPVIAVDADPKTPEKQAVKESDYTIHEADTRELLDEIYDEDIAPYHEFERVGSPNRVETELTKAVAGVIDHAKELEKHVNCYTKAVFQVIGYVSDAFSASLKPVNEYVISPALDALDTRVRRTLRDDCRFSQGFAQDAGDMSSFVAGLLIPCKISKVPGKITKLKVPDRVAQRKVGNVGKYKDLIEGRPFNDGKEVHHFPAQRYLKANDLDTNEALSIVLTKEQHAKTRTFKRRVNKIDIDAPYRSEVACDIKDIKSILKEDGTWNSEIRQSILKGLDNFREEYPELFKKVNK